MLRASVFVGTSLDGFIARINGDIDWLPIGGGEDHGYNAFIASVDALVIGRNTFETVMSFGGWPYGPKPVFVLTNRPLVSPPPAEAVLECLSGPPAEIAATLEARGFRHLYIDGGLVIQQFLRAGLIQTMTITRVPRLIGSGIPLFGPLPHDVVLHHMGTTHSPSGLVTSVYAIAT
jgi:dihydrofolate reductase